MNKKILLLGVTILIILGIIVPYAISESSDTGTVNVEINATVTIDVDNSPMAFALDPGLGDQNGSSDIPFRIVNTGSVDIDVSTCAGRLHWKADANDTNYYRWMMDQNEASSCTSIRGGISDKNWVDFNITDTSDASGTVCTGLQFENSTDSINVGIFISSPSGEPDTTSLSSTVTFYVAQDSGAGDQSLQANCN